VALVGERPRRVCITHDVHELNAAENDATRQRLLGKPQPMSIGPRVRLSACGRYSCVNPQPASVVGRPAAVLDVLAGAEDRAGATAPTAQVSVVLLLRTAGSSRELTRAAAPAWRRAEQGRRCGRSRTAPSTQLPDIDALHRPRTGAAGVEFEQREGVKGPEATNVAPIVAPSRRCVTWAVAASAATAQGCCPPAPRRAVLVPGHR
jgi:hypothetical protein